MALIVMVSNVLEEGITQVFLSRPLADDEHDHCEELLGYHFDEDSHGFPVGHEHFGHWMSIAYGMPPELEAYLNTLS